MLELRKIAITGGIASGKSSALAILKEFGAYTVDADEIVHSLLEEDKETIESIISLLGHTVYINGKLDRRHIAQKVFNQDTTLLKKLENILHPKVFHAIQLHYQQAQKKGSVLFAVEMALLFETHCENWFDFTVAILADPQLCRQRFGNEYDQRMFRQWSPEEKARHADFIIYNNQDKSHLKQEVRKIFQLIAQ